MIRIVTTIARVPEQPESTKHLWITTTNYNIFGLKLKVKQTRVTDNTTLLPIAAGLHKK